MSNLCHRGTHTVLTLNFKQSTTTQTSLKGLTCRKYDNQQSNSPRPDFKRLFSSSSSAPKENNRRLPGQRLQDIP